MKNNLDIRNMTFSYKNRFFVKSLVLAFTLGVPNIVVNANDRNDFELQQSRKISGTVVDANGEPIIGANVIVKGTTNGTVTDLDGAFMLETTSAKAILLVSYIGYNSVEYVVNDTKNIKIKLNEDSQALDEVIVTALGISKSVEKSGHAVTAFSQNKVVDFSH